MNRAIFLDRDGTLLVDVPYLSDPAHVRLLPGAAQAVRLFGGLGFACIVVTNQSAVGRRLITLERLHEIHAEMNRQLEEQGARLNGIYFSTGVPQSTDRTLVEEHDRKPGPGMLLRAARELSLDISRSWMIGDMISDMLAGRNAGCAGTILVRTGQGMHVDRSHSAIDDSCESLLDAARIIAVSKTLGAAQIGMDVGHDEVDVCTPIAIEKAS